MRIDFKVEGDLKRLLGELYDDVAKIIQSSVRAAATGLQTELRQQVVAAGLGGGVDKAWNLKVYPTGSRASASAAGYVYSKAKRIHAAFAAGGTISARGGKWMVIPLDGAVRRGWHVEQGGGGFGKPRKWSWLGGAIQAGKLAWIPVRGSNRVIVALRKGKAVEPVFLLVKQVRLRKVLDIDGPARRALDRLHADLSAKVGA